MGIDNCITSVGLF